MAKIDFFSVAATSLGFSSVSSVLGGCSFGSSSLGASGAGAVAGSVAVAVSVLDGGKRQVSGVRDQRIRRRLKGKRIRYIHISLVGN